MSGRGERMMTDGKSGTVTLTEREAQSLLDAVNDSHVVTWMNPSMVRKLVEKLEHLAAGLM